MTPQSHLLTAGALADALRPRGVLSDDFRGAVAHPVNDVADADALLEGFLQPLHRALPDIQRHPLIAIANEDPQGRWELGTGYLLGTFREALFGIPATGRTAFLRYTEMVRLAGDQIAQWFLIPDFIDLMEQASVSPLRPSLGAGGRVMPPMKGDGLFPAGDGQATSDLVMAMLAHLGEYDGQHLASMDLARYWSPDFLWYGPGGIGTTRGIDGFRAHHQGPFLRAFPDRVVDYHAATVAAGDFAATGGWPHMHATHSGPGWLGLPPTNVHLELRVMDIWRRDGDLLRENWVAIDIIHMLRQMGLDVFEQMRLQARAC